VAVEMVRGWAGIASYALEVEEVAETSRDHPQTEQEIQHGDTDIQTKELARVP